MHKVNSNRKKRK